jgi:hypothetical protein
MIDAHMQRSAERDVKFVEQKLRYIGPHVAELHVQYGDNPRPSHDRSQSSGARGSHSDYRGGIGSGGSCPAI